MSKLIIGKHKNKVDYLKNHFLKYDFKNYSSYYGDKIQAYFFKKLNLDNFNYLEIGNDFVATTGTIIYKELIGKDALERIYEDQSLGINYIRDNSIGCYSITIKRKNIISIYTDPNALQNVYYYNTNNDWMITNTYYHLAKLIDEVRINQLELLECSFNNTIIGNESPFWGIHRLYEDESVTINTDTNDFRIDKIIMEKKLNYGFNTTEKFATQLGENARIISDTFKNITVSMTGGLDSRIIAAALLRNKISPQIVYGVGNSPLTNTKNRDLEINKIYAQKFSLKLKEMNWETNNPVDEYWKESLEKYGELFIADAGNRNIYKAYEEEVKFEYITFGYFGELLRNIKWIDSIKSDYFTIEQYVRLYINNYIPIEKKVKDELYNNILKKYIIICKKENIDENHIHKDQFSLLHYHYRKNADSAMCNLMNLYAYSTNILSEKPILYSLLNTPYEYKMNSKFVLETIDYLYPELLEVPFFSHSKNLIFNRETFNLIDVKRKIEFIEIVKKYINKTKYSSIIKNIYKIVINSDKKSKSEAIRLIEIRKFASDYLTYNNDELLKVDKFNGDVRHLMKYTQFNYMCNELKERRKL